jgi:hypothetical protein
MYPMPNGNILILAIEVINGAEAIQMGKLLTSFQANNYEINTGTKTEKFKCADIVWEWNVKDHLIQVMTERKIIME